MHIHMCIYMHIHIISDNDKYCKVKSRVRTQAMIWVGGVPCQVGWSGEFSLRP